MRIFAGLVIWVVISQPKCQKACCHKDLRLCTLRQDFLSSRIGDCQHGRQKTNMLRTAFGLRDNVYLDTIRERGRCRGKCDQTRQDMTGVGKINKEATLVSQ